MTAPIFEKAVDAACAIIEATLRHNQWNRQLTAVKLEINRTTLYKKMKRYNLEVDPMLRTVPT